jgi:hypothetical protein
MYTISADVLKEKIELHQKWLNNAGGERLVLIDYNLSGSDLSGSDLSGSNLDFSSFPLWCGGSKFKCSEKLVQQLFAHICTLDVEDASDEMKIALKTIKSEAAKSHRAIDLGIIRDRSRKLL